jgi:hypothetical protein
MKFFKKYSLVIFCFLIAITILTVSKIEAASIGTISASDNSNVNSQAGICTVPSGSNQCVVSVNWNVSTPGQNVLITAGRTNIVSGSIAGPYLYTASYTESPVKFILYNNNNGEYSAETSISLSCASGSYWSSSQGKCASSPNGDLYGYPTYTGSTCTVAQGQTTCNVGMAWRTDDSLYATYSAITTQGATVGSSVNVATGNSGNTTYPLKAGEKRTFYLYHNGVLLDQQEFSAVEGPRVTFKVVKDVGTLNEETIPTSEGSFTKRVGGLLKSFFGLRTSSPVKDSTPIQIHWEAIPENAFDINTVECTMPDGITKVKNKLSGYYPENGSISTNSTTTYSITCKDGQTDSTVSTTSTVPSIYGVTLTNVLGNPPSNPTIPTASGSTYFYDPSDDVNYVSISWNTKNVDSCKVDNTPIQGSAGQYTWDGNKYSALPPTVHIVCTESSSGESASLVYHFQDCGDDDVCSLLD